MKTVIVVLAVLFLLSACDAAPTPVTATPTPTPTPIPATLFWPIGVPNVPGEDDLFGAYRTEDRSHGGLDLDASIGTEIYAVKAGVIECAEWVEGYGWLIIISHTDGVETYYGHMRYDTPFAVKFGDVVLRGQLIGYVGNTGWSTGPHLHFEYRIDGTAIDPYPLLFPEEKIT